MVGREDLMNAIALNSSMFNASRVVGPAVAGILVASIGEGWCFFANGVSYIAVIVGLLLMTVAAHKPVKQPGTPLADVIEGFRFVIGSPPIHYLMILLGIVSLTGMPYHGADADFRGPAFCTAARGVGHADGRVGRWCAGRRLLLAVAANGERPGAMGGNLGGRLRSSLIRSPFRAPFGFRARCCCRSALP